MFLARLRQLRVPPAFAVFQHQKDSSVSPALAGATASQGSPAHTTLSLTKSALQHKVPHLYVGQGKHERRQRSLAEATQLLSVLVPKTSLASNLKKLTIISAYRPAHGAFSAQGIRVFHGLQQAFHYPALNTTLSTASQITLKLGSVASTITQL